MRTTLDIPEALLKKAMKVSHSKTKTNAVILGLQELIRREKIEELRGLRGKFSVDIDTGELRGRKKIDSHS